MSPSEPAPPPRPRPREKKTETPVLRPHVYDGIQEFDQRLPNWWLATLYIAIVWALFSWVWEFQISRPLNLATPDGKRVEGAVAEVRSRQAAELEKLLSSLDDRRFWEMAKNPDVTARGQATYESICAACHAKDLTATLEGTKLSGLPLHDAEWKYGGKPLDVFRTVSKGSPDQSTGMIAWEPALGAAKVAEVVAYILSTHQPGEDLSAH